MARNLVPSLLIAMFVVFPAHGQETASPAARLRAIQDEVADAANAFYQAANKLGWESDPQVGRLSEALQTKKRNGIAAAMEIAKADPQSEVGFDALEWLLIQDWQSSIAASAIELMTRHHAKNPRIGSTAARLGYYIRYSKALTYEKATELLKAVLMENPDKISRGQAAMGFARRAIDAHDLAQVAGSDEQDALAKKAEDFLQSVIRNFGECPDLTGRWDEPKTLADVAGSELHAIQNLRVGKPAPEIDAEDLNGERFKLSDYRGKVVLLVFWASWCGPCMADVPHERELVESLRGRPFVLIGVNGDDDRTRALAVATDKQMHWRSFWNGPNHRKGPISTTWNVNAWPTLYVIDHNGVICIKGDTIGGNDFDQALKSLIDKAEKSETE